MKFKFLLCLVFLSEMCFGQDESKFCVEIAPLAYINPIYATPSYELGSEVKLYHNLALYVEGGGYFGLNHHDWITEIYAQQRLNDVQGYCVKAELKYYLNTAHLASEDYVSVEGMYKKQEFNWQDSIRLTPAYVTTFRDYKSVYCFTLKYGYFQVYDRFIFDFYLGLGLRFKNVTSGLTAAQQGSLQYNDDYPYDSDGVGIMTDPGGRSILPNIEMGFKIGYSIK